MILKHPIKGQTNTKQNEITASKSSFGEFYKKAEKGA